MLGILMVIIGFLALGLASLWGAKLSLHQAGSWLILMLSKERQDSTAGTWARSVTALRVVSVGTL